MKTRRILGIETSCDETAAAVVGEDQSVQSSVVLSQVKEHAPYGGIVPEVAARAHDRTLQPVLAQALAEGGIREPAAELEAVAVTVKPGLIGALHVGVSAAKTLAWTWGKPLIAVDHLHGHIHSARMAAVMEGAPVGDAEPYVALVVSGGHTALYEVRGPLDTDITRMGKTRDDAAGEAFDKAAALLELPYPGGPSIQRAGETGNPKVVRFPRALIDDASSFDFSFSGLKTSVYYYLHGQNAGHGAKHRGPAGEIAGTADIAASFEQAVVDVLVHKAVRACEQRGIATLAVVGGVAANARLRRDVQAACGTRGLRLLVPPLWLCTDNAAMIAGMAWSLYRAGRTAPYTVEAQPR